jgi:DNA mismatch repair ATPase MutS
VCNDIHCLSEGSFFVVTGANMAGKSTYLRTVAVNYLLALVGAPVFAAEMTFSPATLYTGLRTSDSLSDGASYFFAELSRLQKMVKRAEAGERMFVILDEILRGTNSVDKQKGSLGLVSKLVRLSVTGIIATHDLALGSLADSFPGKVSNYRFEAEIDGSRLTFSYRLLPGIAQNTNAYFLMQTMGII